MARIPDDQIDRLKQDIAIQRLAEMRGITLKRHGADLIGEQGRGSPISRPLSRAQNCPLKPNHYLASIKWQSNGNFG